MTLEQIKKNTDRYQSLASQSDISAWVAANAGTGKTYVLVQRILRLLLSGVKPERILCVTFTKAAASEMENRLFDKLGNWATLSDDELTKVLHGLLNHHPSDDHLLEARRLFARALETPGGLKVHTIHAFCERLLKRFPLEAGITPHFKILDDEAKKELTSSAIDQVLQIATQDEDSELGQALISVIGYAGEDRFYTLLNSILHRPQSLSDSLDRARLINPDNIYKSLIQDLSKAFEVASDASIDALLASSRDLLSPNEIEMSISALLDGKKTDQDIANGLLKAKGETDDVSYYTLLCKIFLTTAGEPRSDKRFITKQIREDHPNIVSFLTKARDQVHDLNLMIEKVKIVQASAALIVLADAIMDIYVTAKNNRSALDFDDLIIKSSHLLSRSDAASWVLYKLDGGIDHILVDEAQDTSPDAWSVIDYLSNEFFAGLGAQETVRTVFAVGDEKQSIYGFQGAEPKKFAEMGKLFEEKARIANLEWHRIPLTLSFRSTGPVLNAVDYVFSKDQALKGLTAENNEIQHHVFRDGQAGRIEIWEPEVPAEQTLLDPWDVQTEKQTDTPIVRLANRIANQIKSWLDSGEILESRGTPIQPGDIIILVRKRHPFVTPMIHALKSRNIPAAGADRIKITEQLAVMDLVALGDFLLMPEDDLSLAIVLKSPFFDFNDDDLFAIGHDRRASLWEALTKRTDLDPRYEEAVVTIKQWLARADLVPPYEFFAGVLLTQERRARILSRLGPEAGDAVDEFLNMAIQFDDMHPPSLQGFLSWVRDSEIEIKRDMEQGRNEVRIMTVHGAKGLEAEIVFMPDTCSNSRAMDGQSIIEIEHANKHSQLIWALPGAKQHEVIHQTRQESKIADREEYNRLLYVAMTRARDRLYVAGFENKKGRDQGCWYDLIYQGLEGHLTENHDYDGRPIWRLETNQSTHPDRSDDYTIRQEDALATPEWTARRAPNEPVKSIPISPSSIVPLHVEEHQEVDMGDQIAISPLQLSQGNRFLRGQLTHALLEHLPEIEEKYWEDAARKLVQTRGMDASQALKESIIQETIEILRHSEFAPLFGPQSQAEVSLVAKIPPSETGGHPLMITGQIDRLVVLEHEVLIVDYKTNRPPPKTPEDVAETYVIQLVAYRKAVGDIIPGKPIRCALLWTDGPDLMEISSQMLDLKERELVSIGWQQT